MQLISSFIYGFNPTELDLMDSENYKFISPILFRVQNSSSRDYVFRHHLETIIGNNINLKNVTWKRGGPSIMEGAIKVCLTHLGQIIQIGEY